VRRLTLGFRRSGFLAARLRLSLFALLNMMGTLHPFHSQERDEHTGSGDVLLILRHINHLPPPMHVNARCAKQHSE
jgi:hypothetical protein